MSSTWLGGNPCMEIGFPMCREERHYFILPKDIINIEMLGNQYINVTFRDWEGNVTSFSSFYLGSTMFLTKHRSPNIEIKMGFSFLNHQIYGKSLSMAMNKDLETRRLGISLMQNIIDNEKNKRGIKTRVS